jgi:trimeric autotransporter adhesin
MTTGHTSKSALCAARIALLAGASAAAIFAASPANAQGSQVVQNPPPFTSGGTYDPNGYNVPAQGGMPQFGLPSGSNAGAINVPGVTLAPADTQTYTLVNAATFAPVTQTSNPNAVNGNGTIAGQTYQSELVAADVVGTGSNAGNALVNAAGQLVTSAPAGLKTDGSVPPPPGYTWVSQTTQDPNSVKNMWVSATYGNDPVAVSGNAYQTSGQYGSGQYVVDSSGKLVPVATVTAAVGADTGAKFLSDLKANGWSLVNSSATDPALAASANYTYQGLNNGVVMQGTHATTSYLAGGQINANDKGQYTAVGAGGMTAVDTATGNQSALTPGMLTLTNGANPKAGITLDATVDPVLTVTNGTAAGTTVINNGAVSAGTSVTVGTGVNTTTITGNQTVVTGAAGSTYGLAVVGNSSAPGTVAVGVTGDQIGVVVANANGSATVGATAGGAPGLAATNAAGTAGVGINGSGIGVYNASGAQFSVGTNGNIDAHGNQIHDVGTPIAATDATNKAYVDKGLNKAYDGTAIALAISQPVFLPGQTFAMRAGWGDYQGQSAFGVSAAGVIAHNTFGYGSTVSLDGGIGVGTNSNSVAGKAGVTVGFGGGSAPLK